MGRVARPNNFANGGLGCSAGMIAAESDFRSLRHDGGQACADQPFRGDRSTNGGIEPKIAVRCVPRVLDIDDALGLADNVVGSPFGHVEAAFVGAHVRIMRASRSDRARTVADYFGCWVGFGSAARTFPQGSGLAVGVCDRVSLNAF
jgi:hypothetical protein